MIDDLLPFAVITFLVVLVLLVVWATGIEVFTLRAPQVSVDIKRPAAPRPSPERMADRTRTLEEAIEASGQILSLVKAGINTLEKAEAVEAQVAKFKTSSDRARPLVAQKSTVDILKEMTNSADQLRRLAITDWRNGGHHVYAGQADLESMVKTMRPDGSYELPADIDAKIASAQSGRPMEWAKAIVSLQVHRERLQDATRSELS